MHKQLRKTLAAILALALFVSVLPIGAAPAQAAGDTGVFTVTGGAQGTDYTYTAPNELEPKGGDTLTIKSSTSLTISTNNASGTTKGCRIVIESGVTANITLAGVNITPADAGTNDGYSGIELGNNATLNITLQNDSANEINGGTSQSGSPGPGIHVPEGSTLTIGGEGSLQVQGASRGGLAAVGIGGKVSASNAGGACGNVIILGGTITVQGGTPTSGGENSAVDIGGGAAGNGNGGDCNTVIILTSVNSNGNLEIGGGAGAGVGGGKGSDGAGIKPAGDGNYTVYGDLELPCDITIPNGATVTIPEGASLTVPDGTTLTNNGTILMQGGNYTNSGTLTGNQPTYPSTVTVSVSQDGESVASVPYGSTVTITATMEKAETATNALEVDPGMVGFYLGEDIQNGILVGTDEVEIVDGVYTAAVDVTLDDEKGVTEVGTITITADFGGYAPEGDEGGDSLAPNTGSAQLTVVESYSIDYEEETITIADGFSLYTQQSDGEAIFTSSDGDNATSLTEYIQSTDQKLYLQAPAAGEGELPDRREITIPARPQAPNISVSIDYSGEKLSFPPSFTATTLEYALSQSDPNWRDVPSSAALSEMEWDGSAEKTYYFRTGATDASFASSAATTPITAPARPAKPADPTTVEVTSDSITIQVVSGQEYRLGSSGEWETLQETTGSDDKTVYTYDKLEPGTEYTIETRYKSGRDSYGNNRFASHPASVTVTTKYETELGNLTVSGHSGFEGHFQYGDVITVTFTPERKVNNSTNALAENTATLTYTNAEGEAVTLATATAQADGSFKLTYDTKEKELPIGENLTLTVSYGGNGELNPVEETVTLSLDQAYLRNIPTVTGSFVYGETLTINYTPQDDEEVTYQWWRIIDDEYTERIDGATDKTYTLTEAEIGRSIYVFVDATDDWHYGKKQSDQYQISKAPGNIKIACDSVTYGETVQPSVTNNTNTGADVTYSYAGTGDTSYGPSATAPTNAGTYTVTATVAETATHTTAESEPVAFTIRKAEQSAPAAPTLASRSSHSLTVSAIADSASGAPAEYSIDGGENWQRETTFSGLSAATSYEIVARYAETDSHSASPASAVLTARTASSHSPSTPEGPSGPSTGDSSGWDAILDQLENAAKGDQITIDMGDETKVPAEILESLAGKDVDVIFDLGDIQWSVDGADIPTDADFTDLDLRVDLDTSGIPVNVINTITGEVGTVQITLAHDGEFGFTMTLTAPLGKENAGYWANLYHYDESAEAMNFEAAAKIDETGSVTIPFSHASQYAIVIDDHSHAAVDVSDIFVDVAPNAWYKDAVQYAYDNGLMTGVSATTFAPEQTTTRAMIVSILARLEGVTTAEAAGFADVNDEWYATAVNWAASAGVVNGYEDNTFRPNQPITREQLAAILMNYASYKGQDVSNRADLTTYIDQPSTWATETMQWAVAEGLISGVTNTELQPQGNATRAQVAAILQRFLENAR